MRRPLRLHGPLQAAKSGSARGHRVIALTLTGLAERAHLSHAGVNLETHITDVVADLAAHDVSNAVLVGHSYGGMLTSSPA
jgi:pimeloyl-ACP methyl ester carboxylesterase